MNEQDYYDLLGVSREAGADELKRAFRVKAKEYHPDYHPDDPAAEEKFKKINEAYEILKDPQKRAAYDRYGTDAFSGANGMNGGFGFGFGGNGFGFGDTGFESIFEEMFTGSARRTKANATPKGEDVRVDLSISLEEAYQGVKKNISVETFIACEACNGKGGKSVQTCPSCNGTGRMRQRQGFFVIETECPACRGTGKSVKDPCSHCKGTGRVRKKRTLEVNVPSGVDNGIRMRLSGEGNAGFQGGPAGDVYVFLTVKNHEIFERNGNDLYCEMPIDMTMAALGGQIKVPTLDGKGHTVQVKAGTQPDTRLCIPGKGMPLLRGAGYGDLFVTLKVAIPTKLSAKARTLLEELTHLKETGEIKNETDSLLSKIKRFLGE